jgi:hypothetical protein
VSDFVEQCKEEWKRLRVPDPVANEMAADLAADLKEAEADGASPEDVLGSSLFDPQSFAASWAAERGVIPPQTAQHETASSEHGVNPSPTQYGRRPSRPRMLAALAAFAVLALIGAAFTVHGSVSRAAVVRVAAPAGAARIKLLPGPRSIWITPKGRVEVVPQAGIGPVPAFGVFGDTSNPDLHGLGPILLILGLLGLLLTTLYWLFGGGPGQRRPS